MRERDWACEERDLYEWNPTSVSTELVLHAFSVALPQEVPALWLGLKSKKGKENSK